jgi:hypothetical protein
VIGWSLWALKKFRISGGEKEETEIFLLDFRSKVLGWLLNDFTNRKKDENSSFLIAVLFLHQKL